jgi:hypothetical protein
VLRRSLCQLALLSLPLGVPLPTAAGEPPLPRVHFTDVTATSGITFENATGDPDRKDYIFEVKGGGVGALDYDNDGWLDLVFSRGSSWSAGEARTRARPLQETAGWTFEDVTTKPASPRGLKIGVSAADYDNDGWVDSHNLGGRPLLSLQRRTSGERDSGWVELLRGLRFRPGRPRPLRRVLPGRGRTSCEAGPAACSCVSVPSGAARGLPTATSATTATAFSSSPASGAPTKGLLRPSGSSPRPRRGRDLDLYVGNGTPNYLFVNRDGRFDERGRAARR